MAATLESQYQTLRELKSLDEKIFWVDRDVERIPAEISQLEARIANERTELDQAKVATTELQAKLRAAESELKEKEDFLFKAEGKLMEVKTNEAYQAAQRENENQKKAIGTLEERVLQWLNEVDAQKGTLEGIEAQFREREQAGLTQRKTLEADHARLVIELETLLQERNRLADRLDAPTAAMYRKAVVNIKGAAIAFVDNGSCSGCSVKVRPQIANEILGQKAIHRCSHCGRVLIVKAQSQPTAPTGEVGAG